MLRPLCTCVFMIAGCSSVPPNSPSIETDAPVAQTALPENAAAMPLTALAVQRALDRFETIVNRVKPVAEQSCRNRAPKLNCQFTILLDTRLNQPPNAFQTLEKDDQPVIVFTLSMLLSAQNDDELAFILGHESAHHIQGHLLKKQQNALAGALLFGKITSLAGGPPITVRTAQDIGTFMGGRTYSKKFELQADALGTQITHAAGYDPVRGATFFRRISDPGNAFFGTHPPNQKRIEMVRNVAARL
jgi:predicted Zn-dependent protease